MRLSFSLSIFSSALVLWDTVYSSEWMYNAIHYDFLYLVVYQLITLYFVAVHGLLR